MTDATLVTIHGFWSSPATWERLERGLVHGRATARPTYPPVRLPLPQRSLGCRFSRRASQITTISPRLWPLSTRFNLRERQTL